MSQEPLSSPGGLSRGFLFSILHYPRKDLVENSPIAEIAEVEPPQPAVKFDVQESMEKFYGLIIWAMKRAGINERKINLELAHDMFCHIYSGYDGSTKLTTYVWKWLPAAIRCWQYKAWKAEKDRENHVQPKAILVEDPQEYLDYPTVERLYAMLETITEREREIIILFYGLGDGYDYTMEDIARRFNVTRDRVRQILKKAIEKLQHRFDLQKKEVKPFSHDLLVSVLTNRSNPQFDYLRNPPWSNPHSQIHPPPAAIQDNE
jgi:RNA polymerase sigma factor (sigma-70 family)